MAVVRVRVRYVNNWVDRKITVPDELNFPTSRGNKLDGLYEWLNGYFNDISHNTGYPRRPNMFYIKRKKG